MSFFVSVNFNLPSEAIVDLKEDSSVHSLITAYYEDVPYITLNDNRRTFYYKELNNNRRMQSFRKSLRCDGMSSKEETRKALEQLAKKLIAGDQKGSVSIIRKMANSVSENAYLTGVWRGMERGLQRQETDSLIHQLLSGLSKKDATRNYQDLKKKKTEILVRDHTQKDLSKFYIQTWVTLLEFYCANCPEDKK